MIDKKRKNRFMALSLAFILSFPNTIFAFPAEASEEANVQEILEIPEASDVPESLEMPNASEMLETLEPADVSGLSDEPEMSPYTVGQGDTMKTLMLDPKPACIQTAGLVSAGDIGLKETIAAPDEQIYYNVISGALNPLNDITFRILAGGQGLNNWLLEENLVGMTKIYDSQQNEVSINNVSYGIGTYTSSEIAGLTIEGKHTKAMLFTYPANSIENSSTYYLVLSEALKTGNSNAVLGTKVVFCFTTGAYIHNVSFQGEGAEDVVGGATVSHNSNYIFTVNKNPEYDYEIKVTMGGNEVTDLMESEPGPDGVVQYTLENVTGDLVITVEKTVHYYKVGFEGTGAASVSGADTVAAGDSYTFTVTKEAGYDHTVKVTMGGNEVTNLMESEPGPDGSVQYTLKNVTDDLIITVAGAGRYYTVGFEGTGTASVSGADTVAAGDSYTFTVTKEAGYDHTVRVTMSGNEVTDLMESEPDPDGVVQYTLENVTGDLVITVEKTVHYYKVGFEGTGAASVSGADTVAAGDSYTFTVTKEAGYNHTVKVTMGGNEVTDLMESEPGPDGSVQYTLKNVTDDLIITVAGAERYYTVGFEGTGAASVSGADTVAAGDSYTFTVTKEAGYDHIIKVTMGGNEIKDLAISETNESMTCTISNIIGDLVVSVTKTKKIPEVGSTLSDSTTKAEYKVKVTGTDTNGTVIGAEAEYSRPSVKSSSVTIPATVTVNGICYKIVGIADNAFKDNAVLSEITIGSNVRSIGKNAFKGCKNLKSVMIGENVTTIKRKAFYKCTALTSVTIPAKVTSIRARTFLGCENLKTVTIGKNVTAIKKKAFYKCTALTGVNIPAKVTSIGEQAFLGCKKLETVTIGKSVTVIKKKAFNKCAALTNVTIPAKVTNIRARAFANCSKLKELNIRTARLTSRTVGTAAFRGINKKAVVTVPKNKLAAYKRFLLKKGVSKKAAIK